MTSRTVRVEPAYDDREHLWDLICGQEYRLMMSLAGYDLGAGDFAAMPWFREYWALRGECLRPGAEPFFESRRFVEAAREVAQTEFVRPDRMMVNLMGPMAVGVPHLDTPTFRLGEPLPLWLLLEMGASGLFDHWWVPVCGGVSWFYDGPHGEYEYWPDGPSRPSSAERSPFGNVAVFADNDRMFHRVGAVAADDERLPSGSLTSRATLRDSDPSTWDIVDDGRAVATLSPGRLRVSLLWAALCFPTAEAEALYDSHEDDLTLASVTERFGDDLRARDIEFTAPTDPATDPVWIATVQAHYPLASFDPLNPASGRPSAPSR